MVGARGLIAPISSITPNRLQGLRATDTLEKPAPFGDGREIAISQPTALALFGLDLAGLGVMTRRHRNARPRVTLSGHPLERTQVYIAGPTRDLLNPAPAYSAANGGIVLRDCRTCSRSWITRWERNQLPLMVPWR
jgi:hypothetical protein